MPITGPLRTALTLNSFFDADETRCTRARWTLMGHAAAAPDDHRLLARLALNWVEADSPIHAAQTLDRALLQSPECPLLLWYRAGVFELLGRTDVAVATYRMLVERGTEALAAGECGLGAARAEGLVSDCFHRLAVAEGTRGSAAEASGWRARHVASLGAGRRGLYTLDDALVLDEPRSRKALRLRRDEWPFTDPHSAD